MGFRVETLLHLEEMMMGRFFGSLLLVAIGFSTFGIMVAITEASHNVAQVLRHAN
jgi:hypothetical protein